MFGKNSPTSFLVFVCLLSVILVLPASAASLKDSDTDGLTNEAETTLYLTDPNNYDTDGDGYEDGYEVVNQTNPLDPKSAPGVSASDTTIFPESLVTWVVVVSATIIAGLAAIFLSVSKNTPAQQTIEKRDDTTDHPVSN